MHADNYWQASSEIGALKHTCPVTVCFTAMLLSSAIKGKAMLTSGNSGELVARVEQVSVESKFSIKVKRAKIKDTIARCPR